jgi:formate hydrogenlyase transcriptional activator
LEGPAADATLEEAERAHIVAALKATGWMLSGPRGAATRLGINRSTLQFRMKKLGIERPALA